MSAGPYMRRYSIQKNETEKAGQFHEARLDPASNCWKRGT
jgi:hypothetical protein